MSIAAGNRLDAYEQGLTRDDAVQIDVRQTVTSEIGLLHAGLEGLDKIIVTLAEQLSPVLSDDAPTMARDGIGPCQDGEPTAVAELRNARIRLVRGVEQLAELAHRVRA